MKKVIFATVLALIGLTSCWNEAEVYQDSFVVVSVRDTHRVYEDTQYEVTLATGQGGGITPITLHTNIHYKVGDIVELKKK